MVDVAGNVVLAARRELSDSSSAMPVDRRLGFGIGVPLGDVIKKGDGRCFRNGINIVAHLEGLGEAAEITAWELLISTAVKGRV
jgi:class 3 adenylate cyclase